MATSEPAAEQYHAQRNDYDNQDATVFVGNLAWNVRWQDLKDHMRLPGSRVVRADVFMSPQGYSKGFGIVQYETPQEAQQAINELHDSKLFDRRIFVRENRREARQRDYDQDARDDNLGRHRGPARGFPNSGRPRHFRSHPTRDPLEEAMPFGFERSCIVHVQNLPPSTTWQFLKDFFNDQRDVEKVHVYEITDATSGQPMCNGIVAYANPQLAKSAVDRFDDAVFKGNNIRVRLVT